MTTDAFFERADRASLYFLKRGDEPEEQVTMEEWVTAEREAGFINTGGRPDLPGTGGFSGWFNDGSRISGRVEYRTQESDHA